MSKVNFEGDRPVHLGDPSYKEWEGYIGGQEKDMSKEGGSCEILAGRFSVNLSDS